MTEVYNPLQPWETKQRVPEQELFKAVIVAVIESACGTEDTAERAEDRSYLCARSKRNARDLEEVCGYAGVNYNKIVETARKWELESTWPTLKSIKNLLRSYKNEGDYNEE